MYLYKVKIKIAIFAKISTFVSKFSPVFYFWFALRTVPQQLSFNFTTEIDR